jgi:hypothetical protein
MLDVTQARSESYTAESEVSMLCLNCRRELFKRGIALVDGSACAGEKVEIKWIDGKEYIECKHCGAKNFIEDTGPHTFTIGSFTTD